MYYISGINNTTLLELGTSDEDGLLLNIYWDVRAVPEGKTLQ
jgi:hypothetical protein